MTSPLSPSAPCLPQSDSFIPWYFNTSKTCLFLSPYFWKKKVLAWWVDILGTFLSILRSARVRAKRSGSFFSFRKRRSVKTNLTFSENQRQLRRPLRGTNVEESGDRRIETPPSSQVGGMTSTMPLSQDPSLNFGEANTLADCSAVVILIKV